MTPHQKAVNEALWAAIEECSRVEGFMFQQSRTAPCPEFAKAYMEQGSGAVQCKRAIEQLLVRVNRGQGLTFNPPPEQATIVFSGSNESEPP